MKKILTIFTLTPAMAYAHNDLSQGVFANILHFLTSPHHLLLGVMLMIVCYLFVKVFFKQKR